MKLTRQRVGRWSRSFSEGENNLGKGPRDGGGEFQGVPQGERR